MAMNARADDAQEGMSAFLEKRTPTWTGRSPQVFAKAAAAPWFIVSPCPNTATSKSMPASRRSDSRLSSWSSATGAGMSAPWFAAASPTTITPPA